MEKSNKSLQEYLYIVKESGLELEDVPEDMKTPELCLAAV